MNRLQEIIAERESPDFPFKPRRELYKILGIGQKRFWQIMRNEAQPTFDEAENIARHFQVDVTDLLTSQAKEKHE